MASQIEKFEELARVFHSLGDKTRLGIMMLLAGGEMNVTTICKKLKLPQSSTSHHLSLLRLGGLVVSRGDGKQRFYSVADLSKHRLGSKSESAKRGVNAAKFGPMELAYPEKGQMAASRIDKLEEMARVFQSLGDKTRLSIITLLTKGEMNVTTLCKKLNLPQSNVSCHLRLLRQGGLVVSRREGKQVFYSHADLSKHRLGRKSESAKRGANAAKFGPAELLFPKT